MTTLIQTKFKHVSYRWDEDKKELPSFSAKRTLLNEIILADNIANACFALVAGLLNKSSEKILNIDGGIAVSFPG
jgi:hypothetical protein